MITLESCASKELEVDGNTARRILVPGQSAELGHGALGHYVQLGDGRRIKILANSNEIAQQDIALKGPASKVADPEATFDAGELSWVTQLGAGDPEETRSRLRGRFQFAEETPDEERPGLWTPQVGAIHAVLGYWTTEGSDAATVVMPTGTGKTEAMIGLFASRTPERLLVVVPSDALRSQIAEKFETYGVLQLIGVIDSAAPCPVVGRLKHRFTSVENAEEFMSACNVVVATPSSLISGEHPEATQAALGTCSHLFFDEAHHVKAPQWQKIRDAFEGKPTLQFTATPFREDGQPLGGRQVYRYPLGVAQNHGYFAKIDFTSVVDLFDPDRALAEAALERLRSDRAEGLDHVLMARVKTIPRAKALFEEIYKDVAEEFNPVVVFSGMGVKKRGTAIDALVRRDSRVVVCVDMLGEGFDLPALKVAAIHDPHKSLGVTLQFVGRFARVAGDSLGKAAVFVGRPKLDINHGLRRLYAEDADWNQLISDLSENRTQTEEALGEFEQGFGTHSDAVSIRSLAPKMSAAVYRTHCEDWNPEGILSVHPEETLLSQPLQINLTERVAWCVVRMAAPVRWGELATVEEVTYELFVVYWDKDEGLLYINTSNTDSYPNAIAKAVAGESVELIKGPAVYRAMHGIERLIPTNVGVLDVRDRDRRFSMFAGANVTAGFTKAEAGSKTQTNIFGSGFENGERTSIGGSLKGRVWSYAAAGSLKHWVDWCDHIGPKLADASISIDDIKGAFILPEELEAMPDLVPLAVEWPNEVYFNTSEEARLQFNGEAATLAEADLQVTDFSRGGPVRFELRSDEWAVEYEVDVVDKSLVFKALGEDAVIKHGLHDWIPFSSYLGEKSSGPLLLFEKDAVVISPGTLLQPELDHPPFDVQRLIVPPWGEGMNLRVESQGRPKNAASIQARMIQQVTSMEDWDVVLDDDATGEVADIVALRSDGDELKVMLTHCKFSSKDTAGHRVADLYEVCGQAQRSAAARHDVAKMLEKLIHRETRRVTQHGRLGFEVGDIEELYRLQDEALRLTPKFTIAIAQPGLSQAEAAENQLQLLAATEVYVHQLAKAKFEVYCSA